MTSLVAGACLAILGARIFPAPDAPPLENGAVLVCDGKITDVGERSRVDVPGNAERLDASGLTLAYGFWNTLVSVSPLMRTW